MPEVGLTELMNTWCTVVAPTLSQMVPHTTQSPAVREIDVTFKGTADVAEIAEPDPITEEMISPTLPADAALPFTTPAIPPDADNVVNAPEFGVDDPIAGGVAR